MTKRNLNQNAKYDQSLIKTIEPYFIFENSPLNRLKNIEKVQDEGKKKKLIDLKKTINSIDNCNLKDNNKNIVLGDGNIDSSIMIIGESPGLLETNNCLTFQGEVGDLLNKMLLAINIHRKNIYSSYAINFRPPEDRKPTSQEIKRYSFFLKEHISIIDPKIIIILGSTAMEAVTGNNKKISDQRGEWKEIILKNKTYPMIITYSPSYLIRFPEKKKYSWTDLKKIRKKIIDLGLKF